MPQICFLVGDDLTSTFHYELFHTFLVFISLVKCLRHMLITFPILNLTIAYLNTGFAVLRRVRADLATLQDLDSCSPLSVYCHLLFMDISFQCKSH